NGHSFWIRILPYMEQKNIYDRFDQVGGDDGSLPTGLVVGSSGTNPTNKPLLQNVLVDGLLCPSSAMPNRRDEGDDTKANVMATHYVGIAGSGNPAMNPTDPASGTGKISNRGMLPSGTAVTVGAVSIDGMSNTMMVAEQSNFIEKSPNASTIDTTRVDARSDCGYGFAMGPAAANEHYNITTVLYGIGEKDGNKDGIKADETLPDSPCTPNRPLVSAHAGGAQAVFGDGSVHMLMEGMDLETLWNLADRDDGGVVDMSNF
ncbi:MAG: DUF1559 domain-containing protein, partial [Pirellulales bacterium]